MNADEFSDICRSLPAATETIQWGDNRVFKVGGRMFAITGSATDSLYSTR